MEERELNEFSWSIFFCVTAVSFFAFSFALRLLDAPHGGLFFKIGLIFSGLGILSLLNNWLGDKQDNSQQQHQELF
jgi:hypothetical protein